MQAAPTGIDHDTAPDELGGLVESWLRHLRAQRMSPATLSTHGTSARQLVAFLTDRGMPTTPAGISREHLEAFVSDLLSRWPPRTTGTGALRTFFGRLVDEGEIRESPMARMKQPRLPEGATGGPAEREMRRIRDACERDKTFGGRRDEAVLRVFMDTRAPRRGPWPGARRRQPDDGLVTVIDTGALARYVTHGRPEGP